MSREIHFGYSFPAIRGIQAHREYFVSMCPLRLLPKIFLFNEEEIAPEVRAQRKLNRARIPLMANYILQNRDNYAFSAITASLDSELEFVPLGEESDTRNLGILKVPMDAKFIINDGQHRRAAIEKALETLPDIGNETISVVFYQDPGLKRCQQLFADLNRHSIRPSTSLGVLYDHRDLDADIIKRLVGESGVFEGLVELEKTTLSSRSRRLFTLSALYNASKEILQGYGENEGEKATLAVSTFWGSVFVNIKEWTAVREGKVTSGEVREDFIHTHAVALQSIARAGVALMKEHPSDWRKRISALSKVDWRRKNAHLWEGRAMVGGRMSKAQQNVVLTTNALKKIFRLPLSPEEQQSEDFFMKKE